MPRATAIAALRTRPVQCTVCTLLENLRDDAIAQRYVTKFEHTLRHVYRALQ